MTRKEFAATYGSNGKGGGGKGGKNGDRTKKKKHAKRQKEGAKRANKDKNTLFQLCRVWLVQIWRGLPI